jgi:polyisoprenoid-binding protein YceI
MRVLAAFGLLSLVGLAGTAVLGLVVLKDRVRIVVAADDAGERPDPAALLRDDVQTVARDLGALTQAVGENFERLATTLDGGAQRRHAELLQMRADLQQHGQTLAELAARQRELAAAVAELSAAQAAFRTAAATPPAGEGAGSSTASVPVETPQAKPVESKPAEAPPEHKPAEPKPAEPQVESQVAGPAAKPAGFLGFQVGGAKFRFDELQRYQVIPELSRVGFDAKSTLHDFSGVTSQITGEFSADFDDPKGAWTGNVSCTAAALVTGVDGRDTAMREHLDTANHPAIEFALERFEPAANGVDVGKQTARGEVIGTMAIRGRKQPLRMPVNISVDASKRVVIEGQVPLKLTDYGVPVPSQLGLISMQDEVKVWIALRARVRAEAR